MMIVLCNSAIIEGIKHVCQSAHFQDLQTYVANWWRREPPATAADATAISSSSDAARSE